MSNLNNQFDLYQTRNSLVLPSKSKNMQIAHAILRNFQRMLCNILSHFLILIYGEIRFTSPQRSLWDLSLLNKIKFICKNPFRLLKEDTVCPNNKFTIDIYNCIYYFKYAYNCHKRLHIFANFTHPPIIEVFRVDNSWRYSLTYHWISHYPSIS